MVCTYNVTSTTEATQLLYSGITLSEIASMEVDGINATVATGYTFDRIGEHTVKYTLKDNTKLISGLFFWCYSLTSVVIPDSVTSIGSSAFYNCSGLTSVDIPDSVTSIGNSTFYNCTSLTSVTIGSGVTSIGQQAFQNCTSLTSVVIPDRVTSICEETFVDCSSLISVVIPSGVTSIGDNTFQNCSKLATINYTGTIAQWKTIATGIGWHYKVKATTVTCSDGSCGLDDTTA